jgi:hypothetical protein
VTGETAAGADTEFRESVWAAHGARRDVLSELMAYGETSYSWDELQRARTLPWPDAPGVDVWADYVKRARRRGACAVLRESLVQLQFPVAAGISQTEDYRAATRRGLAPVAAADWRPHRPDEIVVFLHATPMGRVPVIVAAAREDFVFLVQALTRRNEPELVADSMGACIVAGYNNWDRVRRMYVDGRTEKTSAADTASWSSFVSAVAPRRELYQDRFILLSRGPYSAVPAADLGLTEETWRRKSLTIRLEHECSHFLTAQLLGSMRNSLLDELLADYMGIRAAEGRYRADWFLRFLGLHTGGDPELGRLTLYRACLSPAAFALLGQVTRACAATLQEFDRRHGAPGTDPMLDKVHRAAAIVRTGLEGLASRGAADRLERVWGEVRNGAFW